MKDKTTLFKNKLFVSAFLVILVLSPISTAVSVDYNSSRSNVKLTSKMKEVGITDPATIDKILDAADEEIKAYANYKNIRKNIAVIMKTEGVSDPTIEEILSKVEVGIKEEGVPAQVRKRPGMVKYEDIRRTLVEVAIKEEGVKRISVAFDNLIQAAENYNAARSNLVGLLKAAGVKDDEKIAEFLDVLYEPVIAAGTLHDAVDQAMVDFPFLAKIFGNERMNVYIGEQEPLNIVTSGGIVQSLNPGKLGNPTMNVYADMGTINQLIAGEIMPLDALQQGKIKYEGIGLAKSVKFKVLGVVARLGGRIINVIKEVKIGTP